MGCVNKSSKEFKDIAARNNLADNTLELITHKYWLETGNSYRCLYPSSTWKFLLPGVRSICKRTMAENVQLSPRISFS